MPTPNIYILYMYIYVCMCDPLCENPAKVIFCDLLFSKQHHTSYGNEHSVKM